MFVVDHDTLGSAEISRRLGMRPTADPSPARRHTWQLASPLPDTENLDAHLRSLLDRVEPVLPSLREVERIDGTIHWFCLVTARPTGNMMWIESDTLSRLAAAGGELVLDVYDSDRP